MSEGIPIPEFDAFHHEKSARHSENENASQVMMENTITYAFDYELTRLFVSAFCTPLLAI